MRQRHIDVINFALHYLLANLNDATDPNRQDAPANVENPPPEEIDQAYKVLNVNLEPIATIVADRLLWINGINKPGTSIAPALNGEFAGSYCRSELIREIQSALEHSAENPDLSLFRVRERQHSQFYDGPKYPQENQKQVQCINVVGLSNLSVGHMYDVLEYGPFWITVNDDAGKRFSALRSRFI